MRALITAVLSALLGAMKSRAALAIENAALRQQLLALPVLGGVQHDYRLVA